MIELEFAVATSRDDVIGGFSEVFAPRSGGGAGGDAFVVGLHDSTLPWEATIAQSDAVAVVPWTLFCTHVGEFLGVPATHIDLELRGTTFIIPEGQHSTSLQLHRYIDYLGALHQLGAGTTTRPAVSDDEYRNWAAHASS